MTEHTSPSHTLNTHAHNEIASRAYAIYLREGRPQGRDVHNWLDAESEASDAESIQAVSVVLKPSTKSSVSAPHPSRIKPNAVTTVIKESTP